MTLKAYLSLMSFLTAACWLVFFGVVYSIDPTSTNWPGFVLFYSSLGVSLIGTGAIIGFIVRFALLKQELAFRAVTEAFRQSFLFCLLVLVSLFLLSHHLFTWSNIVFLIIALTLIEFLMINYSRSRILHNK
jgi:hypothetical protein